MLDIVTDSYDYLKNVLCLFHFIFPILKSLLLLYSFIKLFSYSLSKLYLICKSLSSVQNESEKQKKNSKDADGVRKQKILRAKSLDNLKKDEEDKSDKDTKIISLHERKANLYRKLRQQTVFLNADEEDSSEDIDLLTSDDEVFSDDEVSLVDQLTLYLIS